MIMHRILVLGSPGSGKSVLADSLGRRLGLPVFHLDAFFWKPGWQAVTREKEVAIVRQLIQADEWIIDGDSGGTAMHVRLRAADTIVVLDLPRIVCLWRALKRWLNYHGKSRPDMGVDCPERLNWSYVKSVWTYPVERLPRILNRIQEYAQGRQVIRLRSTTAVAQFLTATIRVREGQRS